MLILLHNNSCSKSQCVYQYMKDHQIPFTGRDYLNQPLNTGELESLLMQLQLPAAAIVRRTDPAFAAFEESVDLQDESAVIALLSRHPVLLQRPILSDQVRAVIGRPFEQALAFLAQAGY